MTSEQGLQNAIAMLAYYNGKPVQSRCVRQVPIGEWIDANGLWYFDSYEYRPKPEPATRPWLKPEDVPGPVCWIRRLDPTDGSVSLEAMVIAVSTQAITWFTNDYREYRWEHFNRVKWEYSTDRKTWRKCEVTLP